MSSPHQTYHHSRAHKRAVAMLFLGTALWGLSFPLVKALGLLHVQADPAAGGWFITAMTVAPRFVLATVVLGAWLAWRLGRAVRPTRSEWRQSVGLGLFAAGGILWQNDGLRFTAASTSAFLTQLYAVLIPLWVAWHARRPLGGRVWLAVVLVVAGVAVLAELDPRELRLGRGEAETLLSSLFFMGQILWLERREFAGNRPLVVTAVMFGVMAMVFGAMAWGLAPGDSAAATLATLAAPWSAPAWVASTLALTVFCTLGAFTIMNAWQPRITATEAGLIYCAEPIFGALLALCVPAWLSAWGGIAYANERVTWTLFVGGALITTANVIVQLSPPPPRAE